MFPICPPDSFIPLHTPVRQLHRIVRDAHGSFSFHKSLLLSARKAVDTFPVPLVCANRTAPRLNSAVEV